MSFLVTLVSVSSLSGAPNTIELVKMKTEKRTIPKYDHAKLTREVVDCCLFVSE